MNRTKRRNRGVILFIAIAVLVAAMVTGEVISVNSSKSKILDAVEKYVADEAKCYVVPENLRGKDISSKEFDDFFADVKNSFAKYIYKDAPAGADSLVEEKLLNIKQAVTVMQYNDQYYDNVTATLDRDRSSVMLSAGGKEARVSIYIVISTSIDQRPLTVQCRYMLVKDGGEWYMITSDDLISYADSAKAVDTVELF